MATTRKRTSGEKSESGEKKSESSRGGSKSSKTRRSPSSRSRTQSRRKSQSRTKKAPARSTRAKRGGTRKYGEKASSKVGEKMHEMKRGQLRSGRSGKKVTSRRQAIAIGLSEARREGGKVPAQRKSSKAKKKSA
jgi:hypothetical protein